MHSRSHLLKCSEVLGPSTMSDMVVSVKSSHLAVLSLQIRYAGLAYTGDKVMDGAAQPERCMYRSRDMMKVMAGRGGRFYCCWRLVCWRFGVLSLIFFFGPPDVRRSVEERLPKRSWKFQVKQYRLGLNNFREQYIVR
jgi:hypothetical protein